MNIAHETMAGMSLFKGEFLDSFILHIPHASTNIPNFKGFAMDKVEENTMLLTDWATDKIFNVDGIEKIIPTFSRLFCDVERFDDDVEPMLSVGRGLFYTNGYDGSDLRELDAEFKKYVYDNFYMKHHNMFNDMAKQKLEKYGFCHVVDCHSFNDNPLIPFDENPKSPDICVGTDDFHTPEYLLNYTVNYFKRLGYSVEVNNPYRGCIIPKSYYLKNNSVKGIMIEVNKRLYMNDHFVNELKVENLQRIMKGYFEDF
jgi:N-formylglutamate deformylase